MQGELESRQPQLPLQLHRPSNYSNDRSRSKRGLSLVEILIAVAVVLIALLAGVSSVTGASVLSETNQETASALQVARGTMETLRGSNFRDVVRTYNQDPGDDLAGVGSAPGPNFAVVNLGAQSGDADGLPGEVRLPLTSAGQLVESQNLPEFGLPRDLNSDGVIDNADHSNDYTILPVMVRVRWRGRTGNRQISFSTMLGAGR